MEFSHSFQSIYKLALLQFGYRGKGNRGPFFQAVGEGGGGELPVSALLRGSLRID